MQLWPAEWCKHDATWMLWPARIDMWNDIDKAYTVYANIANAIAKYEPLKMIVNPNQIDIARKYLDEKIELISCAIDDSWARDVMPIFCLKDGKLLANNYDFNCWGNKFSPYDADKQVKHTIAEQNDWSLQKIDMVLEGGAVHSNGAGVLLTTQECLLNPNRNPNLSESEIENKLKETLIVDRVLWLPHGVAGDVDTDGHIDNIACFVDEKTIVIQSCDDKNDENYARHKANMEYLNEFASDFEIIEIPQPQAQYFENERLALSYINFYIANDSIIMPAFNDKNDAKAKQILEECFATRNIEQIDILDLVAGGGGIHCITMQQPAIINGELNVKN